MIKAVATVGLAAMVGIVAAQTPLWALGDTSRTTFRVGDGKRGYIAVDLSLSPVGEVWQPVDLRTGHPLSEEMVRYFQIWQFTSDGQMVFEKQEFGNGNAYLIDGYIPVASFSDYEYAAGAEPTKNGGYYLVNRSWSYHWSGIKKEGHGEGSGRLAGDNDDYAFVIVDRAISRISLKTGELVPLHRSIPEGTYIAKGRDGMLVGAKGNELFAYQVDQRKIVWAGIGDINATEIVAHGKAMAVGWGPWTARRTTLYWLDGRVQELPADQQILPDGMTLVLPMESGNRRPYQNLLTGKKTYLREWSPMPLGFGVANEGMATDADRNALVYNDGGKLVGTRKLTWEVPGAEWMGYAKDLRTAVYRRGNVIGRLNFFTGETRDWVAAEEGDIVFDSHAKWMTVCRVNPVTRKIDVTGVSNGGLKTRYNLPEGTRIWGGDQDRLFASHTQTSDSGRKASWLRVYHPTRGERLASIPLGEVSPFRMAWNEKADKVIFSTPDLDIYVVDVATGTVRKSQRKLDYIYSPMFLSPDGARFFADGRLTKTSDDSLVFGTSYPTQINQALFSPDGSRLQIQTVLGVRVYALPVDP